MLEKTPALGTNMIKHIYQKKARAFTRAAHGATPALISFHGI